MQKTSFGSDNHSGVHPQIFASLQSANIGHEPAYGTDRYSELARAVIQQNFGSSVESFFVFNGTAANVLCLQSLIKSYEAVIAAQTSHLHMDECGAPEKSIGCKLLLCPTADGKISVADIDRQLIRLGDQHYSQPKLVSITLPTEYGTCYSLEELRAIREFTRKNNLYLHIDGARLIYAAQYLKCSLLDLTERLGVDAVSFGGTKNGLLFGEVVLLYNELAKQNFKYLRKQSMQLPSKMRFLAQQFCVFLDQQKPLWQEVAEHGHSVALYLESRLKEIPELQITQKVQANSVFVRIPKKWVKYLREHYFFYIWDESTFEARLMISFDTQKNAVDAFIKLFHEVRQNEL